MRLPLSLLLRLMLLLLRFVTLDPLIALLVESLVLLAEGVLVMVVDSVHPGRWTQ